MLVALLSGHASDVIYDNAAWLRSLGIVLVQSYMAPALRKHLNARLHGSKALESFNSNATWLQSLESVWRQSYMVPTFRKRLNATLHGLKV